MPFRISCLTPNSCGPAHVFSVNNTNAAKNTTATFSKAGTYHFLVTIADQEGLSTTSNVDVMVEQMLTTIIVSPSSVDMSTNGTQQFTATGKDQFGMVLNAQPNFSWTTTAGTINQNGLLTAPGIPISNGTVTATNESIHGDGMFTVLENVDPRWGTVQLRLRNRTDSGYLEWMDEWSGCWVEIWASGDASAGIGEFDVSLAEEWGCFEPDMAQIVAGPEVDGASLTATRHEDGTVQVTGTMLHDDAGQGSQVLLAKVYFKPVPGQSVLPRDTDGKYLEPVYDAGFYFAEANLTQAADTTVHLAKLDARGPVPLWPVMYDLDGSGGVGLSDVLRCLSVYQVAVDETASPDAWASDFDRSGRVDLADILDLLGQYRWQKGEGTSVTYPDEFPCGSSSTSSAGLMGAGATIMATYWQPTTTTSINLLLGSFNDSDTESSLEAGAATLETSCDHWSYYDGSILSISCVTYDASPNAGTSLFMNDFAAVTESAESSSESTSDYADAIFEVWDEGELLDLGLDWF